MTMSLHYSFRKNYLGQEGMKFCRSSFPDLYQLLILRRGLWVEEVTLWWQKLLVFVIYHSISSFNHCLTLQGFVPKGIHFECSLLSGKVQSRFLEGLSSRQV